MQGRFKLQMKALLISAVAAACGFMMVFFFYDGPVRTPRFLASAEATETEFFTTSQTQNTVDSNKLNARNIALPLGFQPEWTHTRLDNLLPVQTLSRKFTLAQTQDRTGSEYYDYAAYLFEQMADTMPEKDLAGRLQTLSLQAQTLGNALRQAAAMQYDGPPLEDMSHLQVRSSILFYLNDLNPAALVTVRYDQHGKLIGQERTRAAHSGEALGNFLKNADAVLSDPAAAKYPEAMHLVQQERDLLEKLSKHLTLRWESTQYCKQSCDGMTTHIRVYVQQTLPDREILARQ